MRFDLPDLAELAKIVSDTPADLLMWFSLGLLILILVPIGFVSGIFSKKDIRKITIDGKNIYMEPYNAPVEIFSGEMIKDAYGLVTRDYFARFIILKIAKPDGKGTRPAVIYDLPARGFEDAIKDAGGLSEKNMRVLIEPRR